MAFGNPAGVPDEVGQAGLTCPRLRVPAVWIAGLNA